MKTETILHIGKAGTISKYTQLKARGWRTLWVGEGKICLGKPERKRNRRKG